MRIELELPDWAAETPLYILSRNELVARKMPEDSKWQVKDVRCNRCGRCCRVHPKNGAYVPVDKKGACLHLRKESKEYLCSVGMEKPLACVLGEPEGAEHKKFKCSIRYKRQ